MSFRKTKQVHFIGIGGSGMSGLAEIVMLMGYKVTGSDLSSSSVTTRLINRGAKIFQGHIKENVGDADVVVVSSAINSSNPEIEYAKSKLIPVIPRAELLAELMRMKYAIAVAGSHGKTTVTSMIGELLTNSNLDPTIIIGGKVDRLGSGARLGEGQYIVTEADESDGSFLNLYSTLAVVTNIDSEHLDYYGNFEEIKNTFTSFINKVPFYGSGVLCLDDPTIQEIIPNLKKRYLTYGVTTSANFMAREIRFDKLESSFVFVAFGKEIAELTISMPGTHNVYNALAALAVAYELDLNLESAVKSLDRFKGIERRTQLKGEYNKIMVIDDYGHHPNEIRATLQAIKKGFPKRRLVVGFEPHRYSRTRDHMSQFHRSFYDADLLFVTNIYSAQEKPIRGVSAEAIVSGIIEHGKKEARYVESLELLADRFMEVAQPNDIFLTLGAGSITTVSDMLVERLSG